MDDDLEDEIVNELHEEFQYPFEVMFDPSLFVSSNAFERVQESPIFDSSRQSTLSGSERISAIYVSDSFLQLLEDSGPLEATKTEAWSFYRKQSNAAFPSEIRDFVNEAPIERFSGSETELGDELRDELDWEHALGSKERYEWLIDILLDELVFLATHSKLLSRVSDTIDTLRDAGLPTIDTGRAQLKSEIEERLRTIGYRDIAKYCAIATSNSAPLIEPLFGTVVATNVDILAYHFDP